MTSLTTTTSASSAAVPGPSAELAPNDHDSHPSSHPFAGAAEIASEHRLLLGCVGECCDQHGGELVGAIRPGLGFAQIAFRHTEDEPCAAEGALRPDQPGICQSSDRRIAPLLVEVEIAEDGVEVGPVTPIHPDLLDDSGEHLAVDLPKVLHLHASARLAR